MDFDGTITGPASELAAALTQSSRLSELIRNFGEHLMRESGVDVFDVWWFQKPGRGVKSETWARGEFRIPGARGLDASEILLASKTVESELEDHQFNPSGDILTGEVTGIHYVVVKGTGSRWLVVFMRESVHAFKAWQARWIAKRGREANIPEALAIEIREGMLALAIGSFSGHARRQFELEDARTELYRDALTGLYNSRYLELALDMEVRRASRFGTKFCVLFVDVDAFKAVNDSHGHLSGSSMLTQMGVVIKDAVREVDVVARYGGDEFVLVLLGADVDTGRTIAERVRERVAAHRFRTETGKEGAKDCEETVQVTVSIGLAAFPENARTKEQLLRMADETMYSSKRSGKNRVTVYEAVPEADHIQLSGEGNGGQDPDEITV